MTKKTRLRRCVPTPPSFNTEPQIGTVVVGLTVGLEEARANGEPMMPRPSTAFGLMGPLAGLGDSIIVGTFIPILLGIALACLRAATLGLIFMIAWNAIIILV